MISRFLREQKRYTQKDLCDKFDCSEEKVVPIIRKLKEFGVLKAVKATAPQRDMSELIDEDIEVADVEVGENEYLYVFTFVGVIVVAGCALKCYPKYLLSKEEPKNELKQVLKVLEKYNSREQIIRMFNDSSESSAFNLLAVLLFLIQDYYENGVYSNTEDIIESNGSGEILWDKTINETFSLLSNNRPYYVDLRTKKRIMDDFDYFKRLHECILTKASKEMKDADLLDLFEITEIDLTDEELDEFGDKEYILYRIENELGTQFNTRKQLVLKTVYAYIDHSGNLYDTDCLSMFGTNCF
jgi:DNA-binding Lrp family transcriptional regulator